MTDDAAAFNPVFESRGSLDIVTAQRKSPKLGTLRTLLAFFGPGMLVSVGYMDPGNWATDLAGGAQFGYALLSVVLLSNLMAILLQHLALKLGIVTGHDLAQACRENFSKPTSLVLWILCEIAIAACDLAEVIGSAIALKLLFGLPMVFGVCVTAADVLIILLLQQRGMKWLVAFVTTLIVTIAGCFIYQLVASKPSIVGMALGLVPTAQIVSNHDMLYIAIGILGATVMPHNLYLHSALVQHRPFERTEEGRAMAIRFAGIDSALSLFLAFFINAAILVLAAAAFHGTAHQDVATIEEAHSLLSPMLGASLASTLFAVALLASGQNSTLTGTLAGQIVMEGFLRLRLPSWVRRLVTRLIAILPAVIVVVLQGDKGAESLLILSQVILSMQLSFAVIPLVMFTGNRRLMGPFANGPLMKGVAWGVAILIAGLNAYLVVAQFTSGGGAGH